MSEEANRIVERDAQGKLLKGSVINPKGNNQFTSIVPLLEALEKHGEKQGEQFWAMVARKCWMNEQVLIAVLKKILPDKIQGEGFAQRVAIWLTEAKPKEEIASRVDEHIS